MSDDCWCCCSSFYAFLMVAAIPFWSIAAYRPNYYSTKSIISIPLFSTQSNNRSYYVPADYISGKTNYSANFPYSIGLDGYLTDEDLDMYLVHNLWGLKISLSFEDSSGKKYFQYVHETNIESNFLSTLSTYTYSNLNTSDSFIIGDLVTISCPKSTLVTINYGVEPFCNQSSGYPIKINNNYSILSIGEYVYQEALTNPIIVFDNLTVLPMDFVTPPEMYLYGQRKSSKETLKTIADIMFVSGVVIMIISVFVLSISAI